MQLIPEFIFVPHEGSHTSNSQLSLRRFHTHEGTTGAGSGTSSRRTHRRLLAHDEKLRRWKSICGSDKNGKGSGNKDSASSSPPCLPKRKGSSSKLFPICKNDTATGTDANKLPKDLLPLPNEDSHNLKLTRRSTLPPTLPSRFK
ncbi:expressed unknown protein [Seminavis robusta]|uniref:Uncharacterized protein n=1 Tax=Seminavis robusta TaxID=568900 RepID=A0A9N8DAB4_9STRA|nr:expressed unknown protein [Seminavis robusta]|eukprot:Sro10_g008120.1 n/a (145) ;mRNA; f:123967-124401